MTIERNQAIKASVTELLKYLDTPESGAYALELLSDSFYSAAAECAANWQDKPAGKCWGDSAKHIDRAIRVLVS